MSATSGRNLAIFCDGTWNNRDKTDHPTSVARLEAVLRQAAPAQGARETLTKYDPGVGSEDRAHPVLTALDKLWGGILGAGLTRNIRECYSFLVENYREGDRIYIFGFSRGAYTARSLSGLLRASGIVEHARDIDRAMAWYRDQHPRTHPATAESYAFRARHSPAFHTSAAEAAWRGDQGLPVGARLFVQYLGVFDTVGSHGVPGLLGQFRRIPGGHRFHDHHLSSSVLSGRHAVGLDETRRFYRATLWENVARLNAGRTDAQRPYQQLWFPGSHGKIGGAGAERGLSNATLGWIVEGAVAAGLPVTLPEDLQAAPDAYSAPLHNPAKLDPTVLLQRVRNGPPTGAVEDLHDTAVQRILTDPAYRPGSLRQVLLWHGAMAALRQRGGTRVV